MSLNVAEAFMSASSRSWDGTVDVGISAVDDTTMDAISAEFGHDLDLLCVSIADVVIAPSRDRSLR